MDDKGSSLLPNTADVPAHVATLYRAVLSVGTQEGQMVWTRYTGFLVINGFLSGAFAQLYRPESLLPPRLVLGIGLLGLGVNAAWSVLNFSGWKNANLWWNIAATLHPSLGIYRLPTDFCRDKIPNPYGLIYWLAQAIPFGFSLAAAALIRVAFTFWVDGYHATLIAAASWISAAALVLYWEYWVVGPGVDRQGVHPA